VKRTFTSDFKFTFYVFLYILCFLGIYRLKLLFYKNYQLRFVLIKVFAKPKYFHYKGGKLAIWDERGYI